MCVCDNEVAHLATRLQGGGMGEWCSSECLLCGVVKLLHDTTSAKAHNSGRGEPVAVNSESGLLHHDLCLTAFLHRNHVMALCGGGRVVLERVEMVVQPSRAAACVLCAQAQHRFRHRQ